MSSSDADALVGRAMTLAATGHPDQAIEAYRQAAELRPDSAAIQNNLSVALKAVGRLDDAIAAARTALSLAPESTQIQNTLGNAMREKGDLESAMAAYRRAIELDPVNAAAWSNLGVSRQAAGELTDALACFERAMALSPDSPAIHSNFVYALHFDPARDAGAILHEHCRWAARHADPLKAEIRPHENDRSAERRLRLGYVSPDLRQHAVGRFLLPLLANHDRAQFQVFCYSTDLRPADPVTARLRSHADEWRAVAGASDRELAQLVRHDRIDILVDLAMHMAGSRLLAFARKPAPVQVTYLAYPGTTGLNTIDYRLTDPYLDPQEHRERRYTEESMRLPDTYWCYEPIAEIAPRPAAGAFGGTTFGCLNNLAKVSPPALETWCRILRGVPSSTLLLHAPNGSHRTRVQKQMQVCGIDPNRVAFVGTLPIEAYFKQYDQIDIALDSFPYAGGTTTCDALWMGVPVITLAGQMAVGRGGASILTNVGLKDLIAPDADEYVRIAAQLASDPARLASLHATLRLRMRQSPLMNGARFARDVERAYQNMWRRYLAACEGFP